MAGSREEVIQLIAELGDVQKQRDTLNVTIKAMELQLFRECPHPDNEVVEGRFKDNGWLGCTRPFRVCRLCGYAEEGWGMGYWKLAKPGTTIPSLPYDDARKYVRRQFSQDEQWEARKRGPKT